MKLFRTDNLTDSIRQLLTVNPDVILHIKYACKRPIRYILNEIEDLRTIPAGARSPLYPLQVAKWRKKHGLLIYRPGRIRSPLPHSDALVYAECPMRWTDVEQDCKWVKNEIVIYQPPAWDLHDETVYLRHPTANNMAAILAVTNAMIGRTLTDRLAAALDYSGWSGRDTAVFEASEITAITGLSEAELIRAIGMRYLGNHIRYHTVTPQIEPESPDLLELYRALKAHPDVYRGARLLRFGKVPGVDKSVFWGMRALNKQNCISEGVRIYLLRPGDKYLDMPVLDAVSNARRGEWFKMKTLLDSAPDYLRTLSARS